MNLRRKLKSKNGFGSHEIIGRVDYATSLQGRNPLQTLCTDDCYQRVLGCVLLWVPNGSLQYILE